MEEFRRTLEEAGRQISRELQEAQKLTSDPEATIRERERIVSESLERAQVYYKRKEYARAFHEWERVCEALGGHEEFRRKIRLLRDSHENLIKVNQELLEIKEMLNMRAAPKPADIKFVDGAHEAVNGQVKNVYAYLSQQLRSHRTPRMISFWWPVGAALLVLAAGLGGLKIYHDRVMMQLEVVRALPGPEAPSAVDDAFLAAQRRSMEQQIEALNQDHAKQLEDLRREHAQASMGDRERIVQLETKFKGSESENSDLKRRIQALLEDNLNKDEAIASLN